MKKTVLGISALALAGCASYSKDIAPAFVSSFTYDHFECADLTVERDHIKQSLGEAIRYQDARANADTAKVAGGIALLLAAAIVANNDRHSYRHRYYAPVIVPPVIIIENQERHLEPQTIGATVAELKGRSAAIDVAYTARCASYNPADAHTANSRADEHSSDVDAAIPVSTPPV